ncbi:MAG: hypothetical protein AAGI38_20885 [Bacteroidota bacterium]
MKKTTFISITILLVAGLVLSSCDRQYDNGFIPVDDNPAITVEPPSSGTYKSQIGDQVVVNLRMADNESLRLLRVMRTIYNQADQPIVSLDFFQDVDLEGQVVPEDFLYDIAPVANTSAGPINIEEFFKVRLTFFVIDTKGASDSVSVWIDIVSKDDIQQELFKLDSYEGVTMNNPDKISIAPTPCPDDKSGPVGESNYSLSLNKHLGTNPNVLDLELAIKSEAPFNARFSAAFTSPANDARGIQEVFAYTDETRFNFEKATYTTLSEAFNSANAYFAETDPLVPGQILLVRLPRPTGIPNTYHLAALRITEVRDSLGGNCDYLQFDYLVSFEQ